MSVKRKFGPWSQEVFLSLNPSFSVASFGRFKSQTRNSIERGQTRKYPSIKVSGWTVAQLQHVLKERGANFLFLCHLSIICKLAPGCQFVAPLSLLSSKQQQTFLGTALSVSLPLLPIFLLSHTNKSCASFLGDPDSTVRIFPQGIPSLLKCFH